MRGADDKLAQENLVLISLMYSEASDKPVQEGSLARAFVAVIHIHRVMEVGERKNIK